MNAFRDMVAADISGIFLDMDEFAEEHDLNGIRRPCVVQSPTARESFLQDKKRNGFEGIHGKTVIIHVSRDSWSHR